MAITKESFLNGEVFTIGPKQAHGTPTYKLGKTSTRGSYYIINQIRSDVDNRVILEDHELTVMEVTDTGFSGFNTILGKVFDRSVDFEELYAA